MHATCLQGHTHNSCTAVIITVMMRMIVGGRRRRTRTLNAEAAGSKGSSVSDRSCTESCAGSEVLTEVVTKSFAFWDMSPCSLLEAKGIFGGTRRLHLQGRKTIQARNQIEAPLKRWLAFNGLQVLHPRRQNSSLESYRFRSLSKYGGSLCCVIPWSVQGILPNCLKDSTFLNILN
jgi:hypothetical protein